jgi:hypothetical protein
MALVLRESAKFSLLPRKEGDREHQWSKAEISTRCGSLNSRRRGQVELFDLFCKLEIWFWTGDVRNMPE